MKEHPMLFKDEMVRAIIQGLKTQTRRLKIKESWSVGDLIRVEETMPRYAARVLLEITELREEPLQDISARDCIAEGIEAIEGFPSLREARASQARGTEIAFGGPERWMYHYLWESINGPGSWDLNPTVHVVTFKVVKP